MEQNSIREASPKLSFTDAVRQVFNKYATFKGRARRSEYWWFVLFCKHPTLAAFVWASSFTTFARKTLCLYSTKQMFFGFVALQ